MGKLSEIGFEIRPEEVQSENTICILRNFLMDQRPLRSADFHITDCRKEPCTGSKTAASAAARAGGV